MLNGITNTYINSKILMGWKMSIGLMVMRFISCVVIFSMMDQVILEYMRGKYNQTESKDFVFELTDTITSYSKDWENNEDDCNIRIQIGIIDFCRKMCLVAGNFHNKNSERNIFNNIIISDDLYKVLRLNDSN